MKHITQTDFKEQIQVILNDMAKGEKLETDRHNISMLDDYITKFPNGAFVFYNMDKQTLNIEVLLINSKELLKKSEDTKYYVLDKKIAPGLSVYEKPFLSFEFETELTCGICDFSEIIMPEYKKDTFQDLLDAKAKKAGDFSSVRPLIKHDIVNIDDRDMPYDGDINKIKVDILDHSTDDGYRFSELVRVSFCNKVVMFIARSGRAGEDHEDRKIINEIYYRRMITYLEDKYPLFPFKIEEISPNDKAMTFTQFNGFTVKLEQ